MNGKIYFEEFNHFQGDITPIQSEHIILINFGKIWYFKDIPKNEKYQHQTQTLSINWHYEPDN